MSAAVDLYVLSSILTRVFGERCNSCGLDPILVQAGAARFEGPRSSVHLRSHLENARPRAMGVAQRVVVLIALLAARISRAGDEECLLQVARDREQSGAVALASPSDCSNGSSLVAAGLDVITPRSRGYDEKRSQWASKMGSVAASNDRLSPQLIAFCSSEGQVARAVNFANQCGYRISVRSGGHQYSGFSSCLGGLRCMQLDVSKLHTFEYDAQGDLLTLGVGLRIYEVYSRLVPLGLALPLGICNQVGLGGHLQSSSLGYLSRTEGLGMDHINAFRIVLADGSIRRIDRNSTVGCEGGEPCERNLFWAALGGSPGSWGVILDYTFRPIHASAYPHTAVGMAWLWPYQHDLFVALSKVVRGGLRHVFVEVQCLERSIPVRQIDYF